ncbi:MAG TPA: hypothetical protein VMB85_06290 [Bryobacteraceae bacterium]|nr:hypothetical protein [Bryobacteraceae bacterium]
MPGTTIYDMGEAARKDISAIPRPLDLIAGKWFVRARGSKQGDPQTPREFEHCVPKPAQNARAAAAGQPSAL